MKRWSCVLLALLLCTALAVPALADVIAEPYDNGFYREHRGEMKEENRYYFTNGAQGYVTLCPEPEGRPLGNLPNGERLFVYFTWQDRWCVADYPAAGEERSVWIPLQEMAEQYDTVSFAREHASELTSLPEPREADFSALETVAIWPFPGAAEPYVSQTVAGLDSYVWYLQDGKALFSVLYTDPLGRDWGQVTDSKFYEDLWVCLDAPEEEAPAWVDEDAAARRAGDNLIPAADPVPEVPGAGSFPWLALGLTLGAVALALLLLLLFRKKPRPEAAARRNDR